MANYKPYGHSFLGTFHSLSVPTGSIKILHYPVDGVTTAQSMRDSLTNADYQVPTGKTFHAVTLQLTTTATTGFILSEGDTADAETTLKYDCQFMKLLEPNNFDVNIDFASGKYITIKCGAATVFDVFIIGYET